LNLTYVSANIPAGSQYAPATSGEVKCPAGQHAVGGGVDGSAPVTSSHPSDGGGAGTAGNSAWWVKITSNSGITVYAVCAPADSVTGP
jgi:hypothetical protein